MLLYDFGHPASSPGLRWNMDHGIVMVNIPQRYSPAVLVSTIHTRADFLSAATLRNVDQTRVTGYRIGWVMVFPSGKTEVHLGVRTDIPAGIEPGKTWKAPAQSVSPDHAKQGASAIAFFVAEVYLAGGKPWKANIGQVREQARKATAHK
jgi:hypothetical protein